MTSSGSTRAIFGEMLRSFSALNVLKEQALRSKQQQHLPSRRRRQKQQLPVKEQKSLHIHDSYNIRKLSIDGNFPLFTLPAGEVLVLNLLISSSWSWRRLERQTQKFSLFKNSNYRRTTADHRIEPFQQKRERDMT